MKSEGDHSGKREEEEIERCVDMMVLSNDLAWYSLLCFLSFVLYDCIMVINYQILHILSSVVQEVSHAY